MQWQDFVLSVGVWVCIYALRPTLRAREKPALETSIVTATTVMVFAIVYASLELWSSVLSSVILAIVWYVLAWQKYKATSRCVGGGEIPY